MLPSDWLEYVAAAEKSIKRPPATPKRRMPKITRHQSRRQRIVESQSNNPINAIYREESVFTATPTKPDSWVGTREVGPGDVNNRFYRAGKATTGRNPGQDEYSTATPNRRKPTNRTSKSGRSSKTTDELVAEYLIGTYEDAHGE